MFMESWILRVSCPKYSWFHEHSKNWIHFLNGIFNASDDLELTAIFFGLYINIIYH